MRKKLLSLFLVTAILFYGCNKEEVSQNESLSPSVSNNNAQQKFTDDPGPLAISGFFPICSGVCVERGFYFSVEENLINDSYIYNYGPMEFIWGNQGHFNNPSTVPQIYQYWDMVPAPNTANPAPMLDFEGNPIVGPRYRFKIQPGHNLFINTPYISTNFSTNILFGPIVGPCSWSNAIFHLNNSSNKPSSGIVSNFCADNGGTSPTGFPSATNGITYKPITITNIYGKLCFEQDPGFCFDDPNGVAPSSPTDPNVGPAVYTYQNAHTLRVDFYRDVVDSSIEVTINNNNISHKVLERFHLPQNTTIVPNDYAVVGAGTTSDYGYVIIELDY